MTIDELGKRLDRVCDDYSSEVRTYLGQSNCDSDTKDALNEIARQTFYALKDYRKLIVEYEKAK